MLLLLRGTEDVDAERGEEDRWRRWKDKIEQKGDRERNGKRAYEKREGLVVAMIVTSSPIIARSFRQVQVSPRTNLRN